MSCPPFLTGTNQPVFRPQNHQYLQLLPLPTSILPTDSLKVSARSLLMTGRLPLLPPGRRDWTSVPRALVSFPNNMTWPPFNWQSLTPDQRTLLTQHICTSLILHKRQPIPSRAELLLRYQALQGRPFDLRTTPLWGCWKPIITWFMLLPLAIAGPAVIFNGRKSLDTITSMDEDSIDEDIMKAIKDVPLRLFQSPPVLLQMTDLPYRNILY